ATVRSVAQSPGSASLLENASAGLRSITPCRSLQCPPTQQPGAGSEHGSPLSGNLCLSRVNSQRKSTVEHPFGTIKQWMNQGAFLMRGLANVNAEFSLTALAYNL